MGQRGDQERSVTTDLGSLNDGKTLVADGILNRIKNSRQISVLVRESPATSFAFYLCFLVFDNRFDGLTRLCPCGDQLADLRAAVAVHDAAGCGEGRHVGG